MLHYLIRRWVIIDTESSKSLKEAAINWRSSVQVFKWYMKDPCDEASRVRFTYFNILILREFISELCLR